MESEPLESSGSLAEQVIDQIDELLQHAVEESKPLEVDPLRGRLFELFVTADGAGFLSEDAETDLTADTLCKLLASRWGLASAAQESVARQQQLPAGDLVRMRILWSFLRLWMEWTYAWQRWHEFHDRD
jgi:hypothetical protein